MHYKKKILTYIIKKIPYFKKIYIENLNYKKNSCFPPGHYYSPIVLVDDLSKHEHNIWNKSETYGITGINLNTENQIDLINNLSMYYCEIQYSSEKQKNLRYYYENGFYSYTDGIVLYSMIRHFKPNRIIEIGSGFSSALMLDVNQLYFNHSINLTFIEPYPNRLYSLISNKDKTNTNIIESKLQSIPIEVFEKLETGDILFVDSSHIVKTGSDVNYIIFDILPNLKRGVLIHFHDIFYPFEYPKKWVFGGRNWNENYFLQAFLMYNNNFEIKLFSDYIHKHHKDAFRNMPLTYKSTGGNLWLERK